jgi:formylglycine-generating enzyme
MKIKAALFLVTLFVWSGCDRSTEKAMPVDSSPQRSAVPIDSVRALPVVELPDASVDAEATEANEDAGSAIKTENAESKEPCPSDMALLPAGTYKLGESGRKVTVVAFCIDKQEVTVAQYTKCVREKACSPRCIEEKRCSAVPVDTEWGDEIEDKKASHRCNGGLPDRDNHPVNCVSYDEATAYCAAYGKRLLREEEWEWAVRGGPRAMRYPWGKFDARAEELCWSKVHKGRPFKRAGTCEVGSHSLDTTPEGVVDMAGNVSEWVVGTSGGKNYPSLRGASFWAVDDGYIKASMWGFDSPAKRSEIFGIRCGRDVGSSGNEPSSEKAR